ncbi:MAG TPA: SPOR domain-containing protein [Candidatus Acidoferrales bacterium]|nr:SPOR domain-containing protein [Candidatus Acidoferrales bacterium]
MARGSGKRGGDRVLESRHLVGLFLGVVLLCSVFFTLGYVMGRTQYGGAVHASDAPERVASRPVPASPRTKQAPPAPASGEWDFYANKSDDRLEPSASASNASSSASSFSPAPAAEQPALPRPESRAPNAAAKPVRFAPPKMFGKTIMLQVAAVTHQSDALAVADALQRKRFPSFVVAPSSDNFYRVQVGPYVDERAAESAKNALSHAGFKAIIKR